MNSLDQIDRNILATLRENADIPNSKLAAIIGLSPSACLRRVAKLKEIGAIRRIVAEVDERCLPTTLTCIVTVKFERHGPSHRKAFFDQLRRDPAVVQCYMVSGEVGCVLTIVVGNMEEYTEIADRLFHADDNVTAFTTHMVMSRLK